LHAPLKSQLRAASSDYLGTTAKRRKFTLQPLFLSYILALVTRYNPHKE